MEIFRHKTYSVSNQNAFRIFISKSDDGLFYGSILYHDRDYSSANTSSDVIYDFDKKDFLEAEEKEVFKKCKSWIQDNFGEFECKLIKEE